MKEIELGKSLAASPHINVVKFIGCVMTQSKNHHSLSFSNTIFSLLLLFLFNLTYCSDNRVFSDFHCVCLQFTQ